MIEIQKNEQDRAKDNQDDNARRAEEIASRILQRQEEATLRLENKEKEKTRNRALRWLSPLNFADAYSEIAENMIKPFSYSTKLTKEYDWYDVNWYVI